MTIQPETHVQRLVSGIQESFFPKFFGVFISMKSKYWDKSKTSGTKFPGIQLSSQLVPLSDMPENNNKKNEVPFNTLHQTSSTMFPVIQSGSQLVPLSDILEDNNKKDEVLFNTLHQESGFTGESPDLPLQPENFCAKNELLFRLSLYPINLSEESLTNLATSPDFTVITQLLVNNVSKLQYLVSKGISVSLISKIATEHNGVSYFNIVLNIVMQLDKQSPICSNDINRLLKLEHSLQLLQFIHNNIDTLAYFLNFTGSQIYSIAKYPRALITFDFLIRTYRFLRDFGYTNQDMFAIANNDCGKENIEAAIRAAENLWQYGFKNWHIVRIIANGQENGYETINFLLSQAEYLINERGCSVWQVLLMSVNGAQNVFRFLTSPTDVSVNTMLREIWKESEHLQLQSNVDLPLLRNFFDKQDIIDDEQVTEDGNLPPNPFKSPMFRLCTLHQSLINENLMYPELVSTWSRLEVLGSFNIYVDRLKPWMLQQANLPIFLRSLWLIEVFYFGEIFSSIQINALLQCRSNAHFLEFVALNFCDLLSDKSPLAFSDVIEIGVANNSVEKLNMLIKIVSDLLWIGFSKAFIIKLFNRVDELEHIQCIIAHIKNLLHLDFDINIVFLFIENDTVAGINILKSIDECSEWLYNEQNIDSEKLSALFHLLKLNGKFLEFLNVAPKLTKHGFSLSQIANMAAVRDKELLEQLVRDLDCCDREALFNLNEKKLIIDHSNFVQIIPYIVQHLLPLTKDPINLKAEHICRIVRTNNIIPKFDKLTTCTGIMRLVPIDIDQIVTLLACDNGLENIDVITTMAYSLFQKNFDTNQIVNLMIQHVNDGAHVIRAIYHNLSWLMLEQKLQPHQILAKIRELGQVQRFLALTQYGPQLTRYLFTFNELSQIAIFTDDPAFEFEDLLKNMSQFPASRRSVEENFMRIMTRPIRNRGPNTPESNAANQLSPTPSRPSLSTFFLHPPSHCQPEHHDDSRRRQRSAST